MKGKLIGVDEQTLTILLDKPHNYKANDTVRVEKMTRSTEISDHFHAHVTQLAVDLNLERDYVYHNVLLYACLIPEDEAEGDPYPYNIIEGVLYPKRTSERTNKQMMTAIQAVHAVAVANEVSLREKDEIY